MKIATTPRWGGDAQRMLVVDPQHDAVFERTLGDLPSLLDPGDVVVVNDAATMPASLRVHHRGDAFELRFAGPPEGERWPAVLFGAGDWRVDTDRRPAPPAVAVGDALQLDDGTVLEVLAVSRLSSRQVTVRFTAGLPSAWATIVRLGQPIQYAYMRRPVALDEVQTRYAARPWAVEMPSAGRPLGVATIVALRRRGIIVAAVTHAAGLSATGDPRLDATLPWPERYEVPQATAHAVAQAKRTGARIVAIGTSVVRALEGNAEDHRGVVSVGTGITSLVLGPSRPARVVDGVLSGVHEPGTSHHGLLGAFVGRGLLGRADTEAAARDLLIHEFGDSTLVLPGAAVARRRAA